MRLNMHILPILVAEPLPGNSVERDATLSGSYFPTFSSLLAGCGTMSCTSTRAYFTDGDRSKRWNQTGYVTLLLWTDRGFIFVLSRPPVCSDPFRTAVHWITPRSFWHTTPVETMQLPPSSSLNMLLTYCVCRYQQYLNTHTQRGNTCTYVQIQNKYK